MSKKKHHSCPFQAGTFLYKDELLSKAFISLSKHGKTILLMLYLKRIMPGNKKSMKSLSKKTVVNDREIELSYPELYSYGLSNKSITRGFDDVIAKGFIVVAELGGRGKGDYNKYGVCEDWRDYGTDKFVPRKRAKSVKYGFCAGKKPEKDGLKN